ncbi:MAG: hypothetical protein R2862_09795 [Thermoanaerobaculia bacterium]
MGPRNRICSIGIVRVFTVLLLGSTAVHAMDGQEDPTFSGDGIALWTAGGTVVVEALTSSETLLLPVGSFDPIGAAEPALHWQGVRNDGTIDSNHRCASVSSSVLPLSTRSRGLAARVDSTGNLIVGGWARFGTTQQFAVISRFDLSATGCVLDDDFSGSGFEVYSTADWGCDVHDCEVRGIEEIRPLTGAVPVPRLVLLLRSEVSPFTERFFLVGLTSDGELDPAFGNAGAVEIGAIESGALADARFAVDGIGRIYVAATAFDPDVVGDVDLYLLRFLPSGALDSSFDGDGLLDLDDDDNRRPRLRDLLAHPDGTINLLFEVFGQEYLWGFRFDPMISALVTLSSAGSRRRPGQRPDRRGWRLPGLGSGGRRRHRTALSLGGRRPQWAGDRPVLRHPWNPLLRCRQRRRRSGRCRSARDLARSAGHCRHGVHVDRDVGYLLRVQNSYVFADGFESGGAGFWTSGRDSRSRMTRAPRFGSTVSRELQALSERLVDRPRAPISGSGAESSGNATGFTR